MRIHGWGNYPTINAEVIKPQSIEDCHDIMRKGSLISRGMGRSYGDSANASLVLQTNHLDHFIDFDVKTGILSCEAGVTFNEILKIVVPKGWFLPVTPGTSFVSVGGAIASDVHGKNHHQVGTFSQFVTSITMLLGTGEMVNISPTSKSDLFYATCGGMGLTGVILSATIKLKSIRSTYIKQTTLKADCLETAYEQFETHQYSSYSVAWIDCLAKGSQLGRSVLMLGEHDEDREISLQKEGTLSIPFYMPDGLLNKWTIKAFNTMYYHQISHQSRAIVSFQPYFYPLDKINQWNKLYGKKGFVQYQFVLPKSSGVMGMRKILNKIVASGTGSFLAVLKMFGAKNENLLSFPIEGFTLALDFKISQKTITLIKEIDRMVVDMGGKIYLTKDALMKEKTFKATYPDWEAFEDIRAKYGAIGRFSSTQSKRIGLN
jgi:decaprenylphospho-beta-D-ribofuranose 2-oxidase